MADKITRAQFAQKIKSKYPQYAEVDDNELVDKMLAKYPQYAEQIDEGKTTEPQTEGAPAVPEDGASKSEDISSESVEAHNQKARALKKAMFSSSTVQVPEFLQEPIATFLGTVGEIAVGATKAFEQHVYSRAQDLAEQGKVDADKYNIKTDEELSKMTPEERLKVFEDWSLLADDMDNAVAPMMEAVEITPGSSGSIFTELGQGNFDEAARLTANQTAGGLASLVPFALPGGLVLGPALLGTSVVGGEFEAGLERENATMEQIRTASYAKGANEFAWELITGFILGKAGKMWRGGASREAVAEFTKKSWQSVVGDVFKESTSEGFTDTGNRIIDHFVFGDEWDGKAALIGFADAAIVGGIVGGKVSTFGQIGATNTGRDIAANALKTQEQRDADIEDLRTISDAQNVIAEQTSKGTEKSLIDEVVLEEAQKAQEEALERIKTRQEEHIKTLDDMTAEELRAYADAKDKADALEAEREKLVKEEKEIPETLDDKINEHRQYQAEQYAVVANWQEIQAEADQIKEQIKEKEKDIADQEKSLAQAENPNPVTTRKLNKEKKELKEKKDGLDKELDRLRPTHAEAKTRKRKKKAPVVEKSKVKEVAKKQTREEINQEVAPILEDKNLPQVQKEQALRKYFKANEGLFVTMANQIAGKTNNFDRKHIIDRLKTEIGQRLYKGEAVDKKLLNNAAKAVERSIKKEQQVVKSGARTGLREELREIDQQVQDGILDPEAGEILKEDIRAEYDQTQTGSLDVGFTEEGEAVLPEGLKEQFEGVDENTQTELDLINKALEGTSIDELVKDLSNNTEKIYALLPARAKSGKAFSGIFQAGNPAVEIWESYFDASDRQGKDRVRQLKKALNERIEDAKQDLEPSTENLQDGSVFDQALDFMRATREGKPSVKAFLPLMAKIKRAFPGSRIFISEAKMTEMLIAGGFDPGKASGIAGLTDGKDVAINPKRISGEVLIHEFGHIWAQATRIARPDLYARGAKLIKDSAHYTYLLDQRDNNPDSVYYGIPNDQLIEEAIATAIGKHGEQIFESQEDQKQWDKLAKQIWEWIGQRLGMKKVEDLTLDQFIKLAATEIVTGQQFVTQQDVAAVEKSIMPLEVRVGTTKNYSKGVKPVTELDTHGVFKAKSVQQELLRTINKYNQELLEPGSWVLYNVGKRGKYYEGTRDYNPKTVARQEAKIKTAMELAEEEGFTLREDNVNPGILILERKPTLRFMEQQKGPNKGKVLKKLLNDKYTYKDKSPYKKSKIDQETREIIEATKRDFAMRGDQLTDNQLDGLIMKLQDVVANGKANQKEKRANIKQASEFVKTETRNLIKQGTGIDAATLTPAKQKQLANKKRGFVESIRKGQIGKAFVDALSPDSNNDFYGLLYNLGDKQFVTDVLTDPLENANYHYLESKRVFVENWKSLMENSGVTGKDLATLSGINIDGVELNNSQVVKVYNYIKDPSLYRQLEEGGVDVNKMNEIVDYIHGRKNLKTLANAYPSLYAGAKEFLNGKLDQHGYKGVSGGDIIPFASALKKKGADKAKVEAQYDVLNKVYDGNVPTIAPYTPFTAQGADSTLDIDSVFEGDGDFYSVMSGNLKRRTGAGALDIFGKSLESDIQNYAAGPLRTMNFLDFARGASDVFSSTNLKAMEAAYGKAWADSIKQSLKSIITGRNTPQNSTEGTGWITNWTNNTVAGIMFFNTRSAILQWLSTANFMVEDPQVFFAGIRSPRFKEAAKLIENSAWFQERGKGGALLEFDEIFGQEKTTRAGRAKNWILTKGYELTKWGDRGAIAAGGAPYVAGLLEQGLTPKQAIQKFIALAEETQQSSRPERVGQEQRHPLGRMILAFANTPMQYNRKMQKEIKNMKGATREQKIASLRKILYYGAAQNAIFTVAQRALWTALDFDDDKDEQKLVDGINGMIDTILRGSGIYGAAFATAKNIMLEVMKEDNRKVDDKATQALINTVPAIGTKVRQLKRAVKPSPYRQSDGPIEVAPEVIQAANAITFATNVPADRAVKKFEGVMDVFANDLNAFEKMMRLNGWDRYSLGADSPINRGVTGQAFNDGTIEVDPNLSPIEREKTIKHETKHQRDMAAGKLDYDDNYVYYGDSRYSRKDGKIKYNGKWYREGDRALPWEAVAYKAENGGPLKRTEGDEDKKERTSSRDAVRKARKKKLEYQEKFGRQDATLQPQHVGYEIRFGDKEAHELDPHKGLLKPEEQAARQFTAEWESHPETRRRFKEQYPDLTDEEIDRRLQLQLLTESDHIDPEVIASHRERGETLGGVYNPQEGRYTYNPEGDHVEQTMAHELGHAGLQSERGAHAADLLGYLEFKTFAGDRELGVEDYINTPEEVGAYTQGARFSMGLKPGDVVTEEQVKEFLMSTGKTENFYNAILQNKKIKEFTKVLNTVAHQEQTPKQRQKTLKDLYVRQASTGYA